MRNLIAFILLLPAMAFAEPRADFLMASTTPMSNPHDLKLSSDGAALFVADVGNDRVLILDPETLSPLGAFGADHQAGTHDVDIGPDGRIYVADTHNNRVTVYRIEGLAAERLDADLTTGIRGPEGVLAHPNGLVYVAGAWSDNVVAFDGDAPVYTLDGLASPHDIELAPDGSLWLADAGNNRLLRLSTELQIVEEWSGAPWHFNGVRYMDVLADGTLIVADKNSHRVLVIAANGQILLTLGGAPGIGPGKFRTPEGVETRGDTVWLSDSGNDRVVKYRLVLD